MRLVIKNLGIQVSGIRVLQLFHDKNDEEEEEEENDNDDNDVENYG